MNREELKVTALTEKIGRLVSKYEEDIADMRVDATITITNLREQVQSLTEENNRLRERLSNWEDDEGPSEPEVVQGEVV